MQLPRETTFTIEETTAPVIEGVQTDKSGFVFDGENVNGTSANRLTFTTGEYKSQIAVCSTNTRFHSLTVIKRMKSWSRARRFRLVIPMARAWF